MIAKHKVQTSDKNYLGNGDQPNSFFEESILSKESMRSFCRLLESIGTLPPEPYQATITIKERLCDLGFEYQLEAGDLEYCLEKKRGNCLSLPLLAGAILEHHGFQTNFVIQTNPKDAVFEQEQRFCTELHSGEYFRYDKPVLATSNESKFKFRFASLDHLALSASNLPPIEMTTARHNAFPAEQEMEISYKGGLSLLLVERAITNMSSFKYLEAANLIDRSIELWPDNINAWACRAAIARETFDDTAFESAQTRILALAGSSSRDNYMSYLVTGNPENLKIASKANICDALITASLAKFTQQFDEREAKFLFGVASQMIANSEILDIGNFLAGYGTYLGRLFGQENIVRGLKNFAKRCSSSLQYHLSLYELTENTSFLASALEYGTVRTPLDKAVYSLSSVGTKYYNVEAASQLAEQYQGSRLFADFIDKKQLSL